MERKPGYYWIRHPDHSDKMVAKLCKDGFYYATNGIFYATYQLSWIDSSPIPEPLIPGKYYVIQYRTTKIKDIVQCKSEDHFFAPGSYQIYRFKNVDILSEGFDPDKIIQKIMS
jgi:hypothetical protein